MVKSLSDCTMEYLRDPLGGEVLLKDGKFQVMMEWEKPYMEACVDALKPFGNVLEVGFGCGYSATRIQHHSPKSHTIIEYHPVVAERAREWAKQFPNVIIVEDTWQHGLAKLGVFDSIFFDDYPLESGQQTQKLEKEGHQCHTLLQQGKVVLEEVDKTLPFLKDLVYTDSDLEELIACCHQEKQNHVYVFRFLRELRSQNQITAGQESAIISRLAKMGIVPTLAQVEPESSSLKFQVRGPSERLLTFLQVVLNQHMRQGSRFSCFLSSATSKYEDPQFVDAIICNPFLDYTERWIDIAVPPHCDYYTDTQALVMTIEMKGG